MHALGKSAAAQSNTLGAWGETMCLIWRPPSRRSPAAGGSALGFLSKKGQKSRRAANGAAQSSLHIRPNENTMAMQTVALSLLEPGRCNPRKAMDHSNLVSNRYRPGIHNKRDRTDRSALGRRRQVDRRTNSAGARRPPVVRSEGHAVAPDDRQEVRGKCGDDLAQIHDNEARPITTAPCSMSPHGCRRTRS